MNPRLRAPDGSARHSEEREDQRPEQSRADDVLAGADVVSRHKSIREPDGDGENHSGEYEMAEHGVNIRPALGSGQRHVLGAPRSASARVWPDFRPALGSGTAWRSPLAELADDPVHPVGVVSAHGGGSDVALRAEREQGRRGALLVVGVDDSHEIVRADGPVNGLEANAELPIASSASLARLRLSLKFLMP
jgi:hypothetical protein